MARPLSISDEAILDVARTVFLRKGINATTKEIAQRAGIAESTLFYRFPTKEALFRAAMASTPVPAWVEELEALVGQGDTYANLQHITREMTLFAKQVIPLFMLAFGDNPRSPVTEISPGKRSAMQYLDRLATYLRREQELGRIRSCNTDILANTLFGTCTGFVMDAIVLKRNPSSDEIETFVLGLVEMIWRGVAPEIEDEMRRRGH